MIDDTHLEPRNVVPSQFLVLRNSWEGMQRYGVYLTYFATTILITSSHFLNFQLSMQLAVKYVTEGFATCKNLRTHSIKNQAKINMGLMGECTQNRRKNQKLRTPSRRVANPSYVTWHLSAFIYITKYAPASKYILAVKIFKKVWSYNLVILLLRLFQLFTQQLLLLSLSFVTLKGTERIRLFSR